MTDIHHPIHSGDSPAILVIGAGGHGKSVVSVLLASGARVAGVLDDDPALHGARVQGVPVLGPIAELARHPDSAVVLGLGDNTARRLAAARLAGTRWARAIFPGTYVNPTAEIGPGTVVFPFAIVGADTRIGAHVIVSGHVTIGHDTTIGDFAHVAPGSQIGGAARVGSGAMLGIGSIVCPGVTIGDGATLGAGAVAVHDIPAGCTAFGTPARPLVARSAASADKGAPASSPIQNRIGNVFIPVRDMKRAIAWYSRLFGLPPGSPTHDGKIYDLRMQGDCGIILDGHSAPLHPDGKPLCFFWTSDMRAAQAWLIALDARIETAVEDIGSVSTLVFADPDGNRLMVCQRQSDARA